MKTSYPPNTVRFSERTRAQGRMFAAESKKSVPGKGIYVTFFGANALYITDGEANILIDPYFSRDHFHIIDWPKKHRELYLNEGRISGCLKWLGISNLDAILLTHSHFDHSMDIGCVSRCFAGKKEYPPIYGCESVANVALGILAPKKSSELPKNDRNKRKTEFSKLCEKYNINLVKSDYDKTYQIGKGKFSIKFIEARHLPIPFAGLFLKGKINKPLIPGGDIYDYKEGEIHSIIIKHQDLGNVHIMGSANYVPGQLVRLHESDKPHAMILAAAGLVKHSHMEEFHDQVIGPCSSAKVFLSHWDSFNIPLDEDMRWKRRIDPLAPNEIDLDPYEIRKVLKKSAFLPLLKSVRVL
jgi:Beta-lactamase superfamily domain